MRSRILPNNRQLGLTAVLIKHSLLDRETGQDSNYYITMATTDSISIKTVITASMPDDPGDLSSLPQGSNCCLVGLVTIVSDKFS